MAEIEQAMTAMMMMECFMISRSLDSELFSFGSFGAFGSFGSFSRSHRSTPF
jgi:hypothetical protein